MYRLPVYYRPTDHRASGYGKPLTGRVCRGESPYTRRDREHLAVNSVDKNVGSLAEPPGILGYNIQYWLDVCRRTGDYAQNLARRRLLLQRLLEFVKKPDILDSNDGLVGESF